MIHIDAGRLRVNELLSSGEPGLNVGCGFTHYPGKLNMDISREKSEPDILASATHLPFKDGVFREIMFTEVLEHVPKGSEIQVLVELKRTLEKNGQIILSTPNRTLLAILLDPMVPLIHHRHYSIDELRWFVFKSGLWAPLVFTSGALPFGNVTLAYAFNWLFARKEKKLWMGLCSRAFRGTTGEKGSTVFMVIKDESAFN